MRYLNNNLRTVDDINDDYSVHVEDCTLENEMYFFTCSIIWNFHDEKY